MENKDVIFTIAQVVFWTPIAIFIFRTIKKKTISKKPSKFAIDMAPLQSGSDMSEFIKCETGYTTVFDDARGCEVFRNINFVLEFESVSFVLAYDAIQKGGFPDPLSIHNLEAAYIKYPEDEGFIKIDSSYGPNAWQMDHCRMVLEALVDKEKLIETLKACPCEQE